MRKLLSIFLSLIIVQTTSFAQCEDRYYLNNKHLSEMVQSEKVNNSNLTALHGLMAIGVCAIAGTAGLFFGIGACFVVAAVNIAPIYFSGQKIVQLEKALKDSKGITQIITCDDCDFKRNKTFKHIHAEVKKRLKRDIREELVFYGIKYFNDNGTLCENKNGEKIGAPLNSFEIAQIVAIEFSKTDNTLAPELH